MDATQMDVLKQRQDNVVQDFERNKMPEAERAYQQQLRQWDQEHGKTAATHQAWQMKHDKITAHERYQAAYSSELDKAKDYIANGWVSLEDAQDIAKRDALKRLGFNKEPHALSAERKRKALNKLGPEPAKVPKKPEPTVVKDMIARAARQKEKQQDYSSSLTKVREQAGRSQINRSMQI